MLVTDWTTAAWFLPFVLPICLWVIWTDFTTMKIPNVAVLALLAVFVVVGFIALPLSDYLWRYAHFGVMLVIGFLLTISIGFGAGDAKFAAAMAPFVALPDLGFFALLLSGTTFAALALHSLMRYTPFIRKRLPDWESFTVDEDRSFRKRKFPFGFGLAPALAGYLLIAFFNG